MKKAEIPVIDLHSDLLSFLSHKPGRSPEDPSSRTSYSQLCQGHVKLQTLAIFSITGKDSVKNGKAQVDSFLELTAHYPTRFARCQFPLNTHSPVVHLIPAFENASSFADESEPLADAFKRLEAYIKAIGPIFYIGLTWDEENRFGGGNRTSVGLKEDGKKLLEWMSGKKIAVDFSHTSDKLAHDIFNFIDKNSLEIPVIASHSNFRAISDYPRNLPDDIAKEIVKRGGLIGLNFFAPFIHNTDPSAIVRHVEYAIHLGAENSLCFGADFFCDSDFPSIKEKYQREESYYPGMSDASAYPSLLGLLSQKLSIKEDQLLKIAGQNALRFLKDRIIK
ncbi:MAG: membrane dipeptidase [Verrucomicrobia bacterium]|nr:membrane dipeptidase [Verrucomicrobiota bacterium]